MKNIHIIAILLAAFFLVACRSTKHVTESQSVDSVSLSSKTAVDAESAAISHTEERDSSTTFVWMITTEYDTSRADSTGKAPVLRQTKSLAIKQHGKRKNDDITTNEKISATKEESAKQLTRKDNKRESTKAETKQPLYWSYILYGVALVILMAILAYWVFTKYRAARPHTENKD